MFSRIRSLSLGSLRSAKEKEKEEEEAKAESFNSEAEDGSEDEEDDDDSEQVVSPKQKQKKEGKQKKKQKGGKNGKKEKKKQKEKTKEPDTDGDSQIKRERSSSFGRLFKRRDSDAGSATEKESNVSRKRSFSNPLKIFSRRKSSDTQRDFEADEVLHDQHQDSENSDSDDDEEGESHEGERDVQHVKKRTTNAKAAKKKGSFLFRRKRSNSEMSDEVLESKSIQSQNSQQNRKTKGLSKGAKSFMKRLSSASSFGFGSFSSKNSKKTNQPIPPGNEGGEEGNDKAEQDGIKRRQELSPESPAVGSPRGYELEVASVPFHHSFTRADILYFKSIHETTTTMFDTLNRLLGEGENEALVARLAEMVQDQDDLLKAIAILRSTNASDRCMMLFHMHCLSGAEKGILKDDFETILRYSIRLEHLTKSENTTLRSEGSVNLENKLSASQLSRLRLEHFYTMNAPDKLTRVKAISDKYTGKEASLWKKLQKQYTGCEIPSDEDIAPVAESMDIVQEVVDHAFAQCRDANVMEYKDFTKWIAALDKRFKAEDGFLEHEDIVPWKHLYTEPPRRNLGSDFSGWLRIALLENELDTTLQSLESGRKMRISELSWRRRWCQMDRARDGSMNLLIAKDMSSSPYLSVALSNEKAQVDIIERPDHKHRWTALINQKLFLQPSRASGETFEDWLFILRHATHMEKKSSPLSHDVDTPKDSSFHTEASSETQSDEDDASDTDIASRKENEDDDEESEEESSSENALRVRVTAFYSIENPDKLSNVEKIISNYKGRESKLIAMLERQYPGTKVPSLAEAEEILEEEKSRLDAAHNNREENHDDTDPENNSQEHLQDSVHDTTQETHESEEILPQQQEESSEGEEFHSESEQSQNSEQDNESEHFRMEDDQDDENDEHDESDEEVPRFRKKRNVAKDSESESEHGNDGDEVSSEEDESHSSTSHNENDILDDSDSEDDDE